MLASRSHAAEEEAHADGSPGDGLRKSSRAVKPSVRLLQVLASNSSAVAAEAPGVVRAACPVAQACVAATAADACSPQAAVGRRLRVFWPDEGEWYCGEVTRFDARTGWHSVFYDDGDREQLVLADEQIEWVTEPAPTPRADALDFRAPGVPGVACGSLRRLVRKEETTVGDDPDWPRVGDLLWGHVKVRALGCTLARIADCWHAGPRLVAWARRRARREAARVRRCCRRLL